MNQRERKLTCSRGRSSSPWCPTEETSKQLGSLLLLLELVTETSGSLQALLGLAKQQEQEVAEAVAAQRLRQVVQVALQERAPLPLLAQHRPLAHQP